MNVTVAKNKFEKDFESCIGNIKTSLVNDDGQWEMVQANDVSHLDGMETKTIDEPEG